MSFNTAIFYDIENLTKGYRFGKEIEQNLSLKKIHKAIMRSKLIDRISFQRAYANWAEPRMHFMRNEILELAIDATQVFGITSTGGIKNVADIQLTVDVIDILHTHPHIETFVIVSGDGGYASLVKKLHEYGKSVIGCGYAKSTNRIFEAVCDDFIEIQDPEELGYISQDRTVSAEPRTKKENSTKSEKNKPVETKPESLTNTEIKVEATIKPKNEKNKQAAKKETNESPISPKSENIKENFAEPTVVEKIENASVEKSAKKEQTKTKDKTPTNQEDISTSTKNTSYTKDPDIEKKLKERNIGNSIIREMVYSIGIHEGAITSKDAEAKIQDIIKWLPMNDKFNKDLQKGINPSFFKESFRAIMPSFQISSLGYSRFADLLKYVFGESDFCIWQNEVLASDIKIGSRLFPLANHHIMGDKTKSESHSIEAYKTILESGNPSFQEIDLFELKLIFREVNEGQCDGLSFDNSVEKIARGIRNQLEEQHIRHNLHTLLAAGIIEGEPAGAHHSSIQLFFANEYKEFEDAVNQIRTTMINKIKNNLGSCDEEIVDHLF
ncbi:MAG: NYN domain-containing protein [Bacteroidales bacterium]